GGPPFGGALRALALLDALGAWLAGLFRRPKPCERVLQSDVDVAKEQDMTGAPAESAAWNGKTANHARFHVTVDEAKCVVTVLMRLRVIGTMTTAQLDAWTQGIERKWSRRFKVCCELECCPNGFAIEVKVQFTKSHRGSHNDVKVGPKTTNAGNWGADDG